MDYNEDDIIEVDRVAQINDRIALDPGDKFVVVKEDEDTGDESVKESKDQNQEPLEEAIYTRTGDFVDSTIVRMTKQAMEQGTSEEFYYGGKVLHLEGDSAGVDVYMDGRPVVEFGTYGRVAVAVQDYLDEKL